MLPDKKLGCGGKKDIYIPSCDSVPKKYAESSKSCSVTILLVVGHYMVSLSDDVNGLFYVFILQVKLMDNISGINK